MKKPGDLLPVLVLAGLLALFGATWLLFPVLSGAMKHGDCVASGRIDC